MLKKYFLPTIFLSVVLVNCSIPAHAVEETQLDEILSKIITEDMTDTEKLKAITQYTAENFSYTEEHVYYQKWNEMIDYGGGDCWANTDMIYHLAQKAGIACIRHDGSLTANAGSGHINLIGYADGHYYQAESGFFGKKPRMYTFTDIGEQPFFYTEAEDSIAFKRYVGFDSVYEIPSELNGKPITSIASYAFSTKQLTDYSYNNSKLCFQFWKWDFSKITSLTIPESITFISPSAFQYSMLETAEIPSSITIIPEKAFYGSENLMEITLPESLTTIEAGAFSECNALKDIYFCGTETEWNALSIDENNTALKDATIHFGGKTQEILTGDITQDTVVSLEDIIFLKKYLMNQETLSKEQVNLADLNQDGTVNIYDLILLKRILLGAKT